MAEYTNILIIRLLTVTLFTPWPTTNIPLMTLILRTLFIWIRATLPRMRYDHLIHLTWKRFLPIALGALCLALPFSSLINFFLWYCAGTNG
jgi:NADH:ubiquinone oxidoreductase subunit H